MSYATKLLRNALRTKRRLLELLEMHRRNARRAGTLPHSKLCCGGASLIAVTRRHVRELTAALEKLER